MFEQNQDLKGQLEAIAKEIGSFQDFQTSYLKITEEMLVLKQENEGLKASIAEAQSQNENSISYDRADQFVQEYTKIETELGTAKEAVQVATTPRMTSSSASRLRTHRRRLRSRGSGLS